VVRDLPSGAARWIQRSSGYKLTVCSGVVTIRDSQLTGATPGRLLR
jgi:N-acyl-D-amino-acid deacylase